MITMPRSSLFACLFLFLSTFGDHGLVEAENGQAVIDAYPSTTMVKQGTTVVMVCRVVGVLASTMLSYNWTCPEAGDSCNAGAVDPDWAAKVQQGNILMVNVRNGNDNGEYTCTVRKDMGKMETARYTLRVAEGLSFLNENGGLRVFFPNNSFVTNSTLTNTTNNLRPSGGNDHIACYGGDPNAAQVTWHDSSGGPLAVCNHNGDPIACVGCGPSCQRNGAVGVDVPLNGSTSIHFFLTLQAYKNQDLQCQVNVPGGQSAFIGVYLKDGASALSAPSNLMTSGATTTTTVSVSWSPVLSATGYYVSYQRQDLGAPPVVTPQYERIVGGASTSVTLSGLEPGTTYRIRVWSTDGASVSSEAVEMDVTTVESAPSPPRMLTLIKELTESSTVELNWLPPLHPNGAIHYEIEYEPAMTPGDPVNAGNSDVPYFTLTLPNQFLSYTVRVAAVNSKGRTKSSGLLLSCLGNNRERVACPCSCVGVCGGAAGGGFIGGVLLTAAIATCLVCAVFYRIRTNREVTAKSVIAEGLYENPQLQDNPAYGTLSVHEEDKQEATYEETCMK